jgi:AraC family transcriptional regulator
VSELITPDELPRWVPGELTMDSAPLGWDGVRIRGYRYTALDVPIPGLHDYLVVAYQHGATPMNRRSTGNWRCEQVAPGSISLLTHAAQSHWRWSDDIEVTHLYLSAVAVADVAAQAYERHVRDVELRDVLPFHAQVPQRIRLLAACLCHAAAHRARQATAGAP